MTVIPVLLLSGCATTSTPAAEPRVAATATPTPTSASDPADPASWVIGFGTFGPLAIGQPLTPEMPSLSAFEVMVQEACPWLVVLTGETKVSILRDEGDLVYLMAFGNGLVPRDESFQWATAHGISIGSSELEVVAAYPSVVGTEARYETTVYSVTDGGAFINIVVQNATRVVTGIEVSETADVYPEYCG